MTKKNDMSILLEVEKYNHYRILQEAYVPKEIEYAITEDKRYMIIENELFDINQNKSLGLYYESRLLKEEIITESWFETIADIGIGIGSAALAATGVGAAAASAIDVLHGISFIYRGETRNDNVLKILGYFSVALAAIPGLGPWMKGVLVNVVKKFIGKPIASLIKAMAKNPTGLKAAKALQGVVGKLAGKVGQFNNWAKQYKWFDKIWSKVGKSFESGLKYFDDFLGKVVKESSKAGSKALPAAGTKTAQKAIAASGKFVNSVDDVVMKTLKSNKGVSALPKGAAFIDDAGKIARYGDDVLVKADSGNWFLANVNNGNVIAKNPFAKGFIKQGRKITGTSHQQFLTKKALSRFNALGPVGGTGLKAGVNNLIKSIKGLNLFKTPVSKLPKVITDTLAKKGIDKTLLTKLTSGNIIKPLTKIPKNIIFKGKNGEKLVRVIQYPIKAGRGAANIVTYPLKQVAKTPSMIKSIPKDYRFAAGVLGGLGLGALLMSGEDEATAPEYINLPYNGELENTIKQNGGEITPTAFDNFNQDGEKSKTATSKSTKPIVVTDYDRAWDYKKEDGNYFTKRKGNKNWIKVTPEMKGGRPYQSIKTNVFKD